jgi:hypothetical protein
MRSQVRCRGVAPSHRCEAILGGRGPLDGARVGASTYMGWQMAAEGSKYTRCEATGQGGVVPQEGMLAGVW